MLYWIHIGGTSRPVNSLNCLSLQVGLLLNNACPMCDSIIVHQQKIGADCAGVRPHVNSQNLITVPLSGQRSVVNDTELSSSTKANASPNHDA